MVQELAAPVGGALRWVAAMGVQTQKFGLTKLFSFTLFSVGHYMRWSRGERAPVYGAKEVFDGTA